MIIEIKDLPEGREIKKIDIHIDFEESKGPQDPPKTSPNVDVKISKNDIPSEMQNEDF